jgi:hypothetical protein
MSRKPHCILLLLVIIFSPACTTSGAYPMVSTGGSVSASSIPAAFHGQWTNYSTGIHLPGEDPTQISSRRIVGHESNGEVAAVRIHSPTDITVTCKYSGEGMEWVETNRYTLAPNRNSMLVDGDQQSRLYRMR